MGVIAGAVVAADAPRPRQRRRQRISASTWAPASTGFDLTLETGPRFILRYGRMRNGLEIGELAARCGVSRDTIRFYEREGRLPQAQRTPALYRVYGDEDEGRLLFIRQ